MTDLSEHSCESCRADAALISEEELRRLLPAIPHWQVVAVDGVMQLTREFSFRNFAEAMEYSNRVGDIAEAENHHPAIVTEWGKVTITWWSHNIRGLHKNDLIMAARTDRIYAD